MTHKGLSIRMDDFNQWVPNGTWLRQTEGAAPRNVTLPIEGILSQNIEANPWYQGTLQADASLTITPTSGLDTVRLYAGQAEYKVDDEWISFRELCLRAIEHRLKEGLSLTTETIGTHLYNLATWIESKGNRGSSDEEIMINVPAFPIRLLNPEYRPHWDNIVFFGDGGGRDEYSGWGVHKRNPAHWSHTWLARFGADHPMADVLMDATWDEALAEYTKRSVKRLHDDYMGIDMEKAETQEIAHLCAALHLLSRWAFHRSWHGGDRREMWRLQSHLYDAAHSVFRQELRYRQDQQPRKRRSKKKTQEARDDWATAIIYFDRTYDVLPYRNFNAHHFYTAAYIEACCGVDSVPDVSVDFEALPRGLPTSDAVQTTINQDEAEVQS